jgi:hypothetical protein
MTDFEIDEIRQIRRQVSAEHDHDLNKLVEYYRQVEDELQKSGRYGTLEQATPPLPPQTSEPVVIPTATRV